MTVGLMERPFPCTSTPSLASLPAALRLEPSGAASFYVPTRNPSRRPLFVCGGPSV